VQQAVLGQRDGDEAGPSSFWSQNSAFSGTYCASGLSPAPAIPCSTRTERRSGRLKVSPHAGYVATLRSAAGQLIPTPAPRSRSRSSMHTAAPTSPTLRRPPRSA
jgi:hypothetical protein